jgi:hypothetical protein
MGQGIDMAHAAGAEAHADVMEDFRDQLLIVLIKRLADDKGQLVIPVAETDDTGRDVLAFSIQGVGGPAPAFHFEVQKKQ